MFTEQCRVLGTGAQSPTTKITGRGPEGLGGEGVEGPAGSSVLHGGGTLSCGVHAPREKSTGLANGKHDRHLRKRNPAAEIINLQVMCAGWETAVFSLRSRPWKPAVSISGSGRIPRLSWELLKVSFCVGAEARHGSPDVGLQNQAEKGGEGRAGAGGGPRVKGASFVNRSGLSKGEGQGV